MHEMLKIQNQNVEASAPSPLAGSGGTAAQEARRPLAAGWRRMAACGDVGVLERRRRVGASSARGQVASEAGGVARSL